MPRRPKPQTHGRDHEHGGADPQRIHYDDVGGAGAGGLAIADEGSVLPSEPTLNFTGDGVTATDNPGASRIDVTIPGGGGAALAWAAANGGTSPVASGLSSLLSFGSVHSSGITVSGTTITIGTAGTYALIAAGQAQVDGPATMPGSSVAALSMMLELNSSYQTVSSAMFPVSTISSGRSWAVSMTVIEQIDLSVGDHLTLRAANNTSVAIAFDAWRVLIRQLA